MKKKYNKIKFSYLKATCERYGLNFDEDIFNCIVTGERGSNLLKVSPDFLYNISTLSDFVFIDFEIRRALIESAIRDYDIEKERIKNDWV